MFERFTDRARRVVVAAQEEARRLNHDWIGVEHVLLGLAADTGIAGEVLAENDVYVDTARDALEEIAPRGAVAPSGHIAFTPGAKRAMDLALRECLQLGHNYVGTEHLLLGLVLQIAPSATANHDPGRTAEILVRLGADPAGLRKAVLAKLKAGAAPAPRFSVTAARRDWPNLGDQVDASSAAAFAGEALLPPPPAGVWIAYYADGSGTHPFATEVEALRYAVAYSCQVEFTPWGEQVGSGKGGEQ